MMMAFIPTFTTTVGSRSSFLPTVGTVPTTSTTPADRATTLPRRVTTSCTCDRPKKSRVAFAASVIGAACAFLVASDANAAIFHLRGERPTNIGVQYGRYLQSCPTTPNCISSSANAYDSHYVPSWTYNNEAAKKANKSMQEAIDDLKKVLSEYPRVEVIESKPVKSEFGEGYYVYAEFESKLMGFIDDVEFYFRPDASTVEYRSASRLGEGDLGANRNRIRDIRVALQDIDSRWASTGY